MKALVAAEAIELLQLPNIGPAMAGDFKALGITRPAQLTGKDPEFVVTDDYLKTVLYR